MAAVSIQGGAIVWPGGISTDHYETNRALIPEFSNESPFSKEANMEQSEKIQQGMMDMGQGSGASGEGSQPGSMVPPGAGGGPDAWSAQGASGATEGGCGCETCSDEPHPEQGAQPQGQNPGNEQTGSTGANPGQAGPPPGQTGPTGAPPGQTGYQPGAYGFDAQGGMQQDGGYPGGQPQMGPAPGQYSGMGQMGVPGNNPGPAGFYPGSQGSAGMTGASGPSMGQMGPTPGYSPGMSQPGQPGAHPGQTGPYPGAYPGPGVQGMSDMDGPAMNPQMDHSMGGQGPSHMGASADHIYHDENRFGQVADMVGKFIKGEANTADVVNGLFSLNFRDDQFWKGAIVGVLTAVVLTNDTVKQGLANTFGSVFSPKEKKGESDKEIEKTASDTKKKG